jgi:hypothetical protein
MCLLRCFKGLSETLSVAICEESTAVVPAKNEGFDAVFFSDQEGAK